MKLLTHITTIEVIRPKGKTKIALKLMLNQVYHRHKILHVT